jgi:hypothetical protein
MKTICALIIEVIPCDPYINLQLFMLAMKYVSNQVIATSLFSYQIYAHIQGSSEKCRCRPETTSCTAKFLLMDT